MTKSEAAKIKEEIAEWLKTPEAGGNALKVASKVTAFAAEKIGEIIDAHIVVSKK